MASRSGDTVYPTFVPVASYFSAYSDMPLWLSLPVVVLLGVSSWISTLDPTGAPAVGLALWAATAVTAWPLVARLMRLA